MEGLEDLGWIRRRIVTARCLIHVVDLADLKEVINKQTIGPHEIHHARLHKLILLDVAAVQLKVKLLSEILLDVLNVSEVSKTEVVNFVRKVKTVSLHIQSLDHFGVVVTTDVEVAGHFVDEYETAELTTFFVI